MAINDAGTRIAVASAGSSTGERPFGQINVFDLVDNNWQSRAVIREPDTIGFAEVLAMDGSGNTIVVTDTNDDSAANIVDGDSSDNSAPVAGAAFVYVFADNLDPPGIPQGQCCSGRTFLWY